MCNILPRLSIFSLNFANLLPTYIQTHLPILAYLPYYFFSKWLCCRNTYRFCSRQIAMISSPMTSGRNSPNSSLNYQVWRQCCSLITRVLQPKPKTFFDIKRGTASDFCHTEERKSLRRLSSLKRCHSYTYSYK